MEGRRASAQMDIVIITARIPARVARKVLIVCLARVIITPSLVHPCDGRDTNDCDTNAVCKKVQGSQSGYVCECNRGRRVVLFIFV